MNSSMLKKVSLAGLVVLALGTQTSNADDCKKRKNAPVEFSMPTLKTALKIVAPYGVLAWWFSGGQDQVSSLLSPTTRMAGVVDPLATTEGAQATLKKVLSLVVGVLCLDKIKNHVKWVDRALGRPFDLDCPADA